MQLFAGTSGFSYKEWKGTFYPEGLPDKQMLPYYVTRLPTVEINNTFYRMPKPETLVGWASHAPSAFRFALKAPQRITHRERLEGSDESLRHFLGVARELGERQGPILFQLPPFLRADVPRLRTFLELVPGGVRAAFEFRHPTWFSDDVYDVLRAKNAALVGGDSDDEAKSPPLVATADWGYLRLRAPEYTDAALSVWSERIRAEPWKDVFAFLKHEVRGPEFAEKLLGAFSSARPPGDHVGAAPGT